VPFLRQVWLYLDLEYMSNAPSRYILKNWQNIFVKQQLFSLLYPPQRSCRGVYWFHHVRPSVDKSYVVR
jgi:hypothetical protein